MFSKVESFRRVHIIIVIILRISVSYREHEDVARPPIVEKLEKLVSKQFARFSFWNYVRPETIRKRVRFIYNRYNRAKNRSSAHIIRIDPLQLIIRPHVLYDVIKTWSSRFRADVDGRSNNNNNIVVIVLYSARCKSLRFNGRVMFFSSVIWLRIGF